MSDTIDMFKALKELRQHERRIFGRPCPDCAIKRPKAQPKILLPGQLCRAHKPHYRDDRPEPTNEQYNEAMEGTGFRRVDPPEPHP